MKKIAILALVFLGANLLPAQVLITGFGTGQISNPSGSFTFHIYSTYTNLSGVDTNSFYGDVSSVNILNSSSSVVLTGTFNSGTATSNFQVHLFDEDGDALIYEGNWTSFIPGQVTALTLPYFGSDLAGNGTFSNNVALVGIATGGGGLGTINFDADTLAAVPENSSFHLAAIGMFLIIAMRRNGRTSIAKSSC